MNGIGKINLSDKKIISAAKVVGIFYFNQRGKKFFFKPLIFLKLSRIIDENKMNNLKGSFKNVRRKNYEL